MGYHDQTTGSMIARLFGGRGRDVPEEAVAPAIRPSTQDWGGSIRSELLHQIGDFLLRNSLDISPRNLALAHAIKTGSDLWLCEKVFEREKSRKPINQAWLDSVASATGDQAALLDSLTQMMEKLDGSISRFEQSAQRATATTGEYRSEFVQHVREISAGNQETASLRFVEISQAMLDTLQRIDNEMRRSQSETAELRESLKQARSDANNDHLTRLPNRRAFEERFAQFYAEAAGGDTRLFVAICDVDHFKSVNDRFGHETGDGLLRAIAGILKQIASSDCFVARHGGEEFVLLFRGCGREDVVAQLERAQRILRERRFVVRRSGEEVGAVTFSAGIADVLAEPDPRTALAQADAALYRAKEMGRDRVVCA